MRFSAMAGVGCLLCGCGSAPTTPAAAPAPSAEPAASTSAPAPAQRGATSQSDPILSHYAQVVTRIDTGARQLDPMTPLTELCTQFPHRLSGSAGLEGAIVWAREALLGAGHDKVRLVPVDVPKWVRGAESLQLLPSAEALAIVGIGGTVPTPEAGVTGEVVVVESFEQLEALGAQVAGRIVMFDVRMRLDEKGFPNYGQLVGYRVSGADAAARLGAKAMLLRSLTTDPNSPPHTGTLRYAGDVDKIPAAALSWAAADRLLVATKQGPTRVTLKLESRDEGLVPSANVLAELPGTELPEEVVAFGGHIDGWDVGQGAHDDGAGVVITMQALGLLRSLGLRPRRTLRLVLWTNEENGGNGAEEYAKVFAGERHVAALETDSGGAPVFAVSLQTAPPGPNGFSTPQRFSRFQELSRLLEPLGVKLALPFMAGADVGPLIAQGVPGVGLFHDVSHYFDLHHSDADVLSAIDPDALRQSIAVTAALSYILADIDETFADE